MSGVRVSHLGPRCVDERCNAENAARKCGVFVSLLAIFSGGKVRKNVFSENQFFHARGDISEMQQSTLADWCDLNTEAKKE